MSIFRPDYNKPGPGINPDAPRRKGLVRLGEVVARDFFPFWGSGLLGILGCLPWMFALHEGITDNDLLLTAMLCLAGGALAGPGMTALTDTILRSLRDEPCFWWATYRRVWLRGWRASLLPGAVAGLLLGLECFGIHSLLLKQFNLSIFAGLVFALFLTVGTSVYFWLQLAVLELPLPTMVGNAGVLFFRFLPRSLGAVVILVMYGVLVWLYAPLSYFALTVINLWLPMVPAMLTVYAPVEKLFDLENRLRKTKEKEWGLRDE